MRRAGVPPIEKNSGASDGSSVQVKMLETMHEKPQVRHCPVCGTAMVAETSPSLPEARPRFACLNCGAVIVLSRHRDEDSPKPE